MKLRAPLGRLFERLERVFDRAFTPAHNPLHRLGALGWFFFWVVVASGVYLYIFFDTGITAAYRSVESLTHTQWYLGGVMRSLHRYASDALVIVMLVHLAREYAKDRYRGARWFAWFTGVPMIWLVYVLGISGYWLVWDELAQYVAIGTSEWLDSLGIFGKSVARNFLDQDTLSNRFFTLMVFVHILVPLLLLFLMWIHIQRNADAKVNPPRALAAGTLAALLAVSFANPAVSHAPADLDKVVTRVNLDWFYLPIYPLLDRLPGLWLWAAVGSMTLLLLVLPWLPPLKRRPAAVVSLPNCNGCGRCAADCPFSAIDMQPRSDGTAFAEEAVVDASLCVACGICTGACPTATPFRRAGPLIAGIELPDVPSAQLRERTRQAAARIDAAPRIVVYACEHGVEPEAIGDGAAVVGVRCAAALPPSFIDFVLSHGYADGVVIAGCRYDDCHYRLGARWVEARLARRRDPYLRARVPRERLRVHWVGRLGGRELAAALARFRTELAALPAPLAPAAQEAVNEN